MYYLKETDLPLLSSIGKLLCILRCISGGKVIQESSEASRENTEKGIIINSTRNTAIS